MMREARGQGSGEGEEMKQRSQGSEGWRGDLPRAAPS